MVRDALGHTTVIASPLTDCLSIRRRGGTTGIRRTTGAPPLAPRPSDLPDPGLLRVRLVNAGFARGRETVPLTATGYISA